MRVVVQTAEEFIESLEAAADVFGHVVRISISRNPKDGTRWTAAKFDVNFQAAAVLIDRMGDPGSVEGALETHQLLEMGIDCGHDLVTEDGHEDGSRMARLFEGKIKEYAEKRGWKCLPGMIYDV